MILIFEQFFSDNNFFGVHPWTIVVQYVHLVCRGIYCWTFVKSKIVSLFLFFVTLQNIKAVWNCACEENKLLKQWIEHRGKFNIPACIHTNTQAHASCPPWKVAT